MKHQKITLEDTGKFSGLFVDYITQKENLQPFYNAFPTIENFGEVIRQRNFPKERRIVLQKVLQQQYASLNNTPAVEQNLHALGYNNVYTVTTGHQLNIFTGPLYFIYKIITTINLAKRLKEAYPDDHFIPVYWMASEDHDFEEISYFHLFGKKYQWETEQTGAVGRFRPESLSAVLGSLPESVELFEKAYLDFETLANAVRFYINELFGKDGLLVIDADNRELKALFTDVITDDIEKHTANQKAEQTSEELKKLGYTTQIFPREINFFYLNNGTRERIVKEGDQYKVLNTDKAFSREELLQLIAKTPEVFSPNVVMRPLYQEYILPNIAYIGGPAEVAYWLQLKGVFDHYEVPLPVVMPRNFALYINSAQQKKLEKLHFEAMDLFKSTQELKAIQLKSATENDYELHEEKEKLANLFEQISQKAAQVDKSLSGFIAATEAKVLKELENVEKRLKKAEERNHETTISQIGSLKEKLFPNGSLQERHDNFLNFYLNDPMFMEKLKNVFDPLDFHFLLLFQD